MKTRRKVAVGLLVALLLLYSGSYMGLSFAGQYVLNSWGLGWVKQYIWAPHGFVAGATGTQQRRSLQKLFFPLWWVDVRLVHTSEKASGNAYPINTTLDDQLSKQLEHWEQNQAVL